MREDTILEIGESIKERNELERSRGISNMAVIRANSSFDNSSLSGLYWRASSHMAAAFSEEEGNEEILKYFNRNVNSWKI